MTSLRYEATLVFPFEVEEAGSGGDPPPLYTGPIHVSWRAASGDRLASESWPTEDGITVAASPDGPMGVYVTDFPVPDGTTSLPFARSVDTYHLSGLRESQRVWHDIAEDLSDVTTFTYDSLGRLHTMTR